MSRVLVTGASGFIGRHALKHLAELGFEVHALPRRDTIDGIAASVVWHECDLFNADETTDLMRRIRPTHLLHCAWITEHGKFWESPENTRWIAASKSLLDAFQAIGGRRFVGVGSCAEYDWTDPRLVAGACHETETPRIPKTVYGRTKKELFDWAGRQCCRHRTEFGWARLFSIYGPCEDPRRVVPSVIRALLAGRRAAISPGSQICDFLHVDDVGRALAVLTGSTVAGAVNVGSGHPISVAALCRRITGLMGVGDALDVGALPARPGEPPRLVPDVSRLCHEIGFVPAIGLDDGLQTAINWWRLGSVT